MIRIQALNFNICPSGRYDSCKPRPNLNLWRQPFSRSPEIGERSGTATRALSPA